MRDKLIARPLHAFVMRGVDFKVCFTAASHLSLCVSAQTCELYVPLRLTQVHVAHQFAEQPVRSASAS